MDGILPLWKPRGLTSHDCVMKIRKLFMTKKVGHTGTLDPEVEGVLPICIGQATKVVPYLTDTTKTYEAEVTLGIATTTEDKHGDIVERNEIVNPPSIAAIKEVLQSFQGSITQIPPMYSAVKVKGKKLYEYARNNETVERPVRIITIYNLDLLPLEAERPEAFKIKVVCSKGTYIRTLCVDIGKQLGFPAHMSDLIRLETGSFHRKDTITFDTIEKMAKLEKLNDLLIPISSGLNHLDTLIVDEDTKRKVLFGQKLNKPVKPLHSDPFVVKYNQQLLAIYQVHPEKPELIKPVRVFNV